MLFCSEVYIDAPKIAVEPSLISSLLNLNGGFYEGGYDILGILSLMGHNGI